MWAHRSMQHYSMFKGLYKLEVVLVLLLGTHGTSSRHPVRAMRRLDHVAQFVFFCVSSGTSAYLRPTTAAYLGRTDQGHPDGHTQALFAWGHQIDIPGLTAYLNKLISGFALRVLVFSAGPPWDWYVFTKLFLAHELLAVAVLFRRFSRSTPSRSSQLGKTGIAMSLFASTLCNPYRSNGHRWLTTNGGPPVLLRSGSR